MNTRLPRLLLSITVLSSSLWLSGCVTPGKNMIPKGGSITLPQIYQNQMGQEAGKGETPSSISAIRTELIGPLKESNYDGYTATQTNELNNFFKPTPNPQIAMYVFPHLIQAGEESYPKPGLTTAFFLYRENHVAMPNELY